MPASAALEGPGTPDVLAVLSDADRAAIADAVAALDCVPEFPPLDLARK